jgi:hypothetical protein
MIYGRLAGHFRRIGGITLGIYGIKKELAIRPK